MERPDLVTWISRPYQQWETTETLMYQYICTFKKRSKSCLTFQKENKEQHPEGNWTDYLKSHLDVSQAFCVSCYLKCSHCFFSPPIPFSCLSLLERVWTCRRNMSLTAMQLFSLKSVRYQFTFFLKWSTE